MNLQKVLSGPAIVASMHCIMHAYCIRKVIHPTIPSTHISSNVNGVTLSVNSGNTWKLCCGMGGFHPKAQVVQLGMDPVAH